MTCFLVRDSAPSSSSPRRRRGAPRGGGEEEALVQVKMDPCFYKIILHKVASMAEVWCKPECPLLLFPLPLAWCALYPWLPRRCRGSWRGAAVTEGGDHRAAVLRLWGLDPRRGPAGPRPWPVGRGIPKGEANRNASSFGGSLVTFWPARKSPGVRGRGGPGGRKFAEDLRPGPQGPTKKTTLRCNPLLALRATSPVSAGGGTGGCADRIPLLAPSVGFADSSPRRGSRMKNEE